MNKHLAYCGIMCNGCPVYWVTREDDPEKQKIMKAEMARISKERYGLEVDIEAITDCDGCRAIDGRLLATCGDCKIRNCAQEKDIDNCAHCGDYPCDNLEQLFKHEPAARNRLDVIRSTL